MTCAHCGEPFSHRGKFCTKTCRTLAWKQSNPDRVKAHSEATRRRAAIDPQRKAGNYARCRKWMQERRDWLDAYKRGAGCIDCGTTQGRLDLDHRPGVEKLFNLAHARVSWDKLKAEVAKCDVRCVACHTRRHALERHRSAA